MSSILKFSSFVWLLVLVSGLLAACVGPLPSEEDIINGALYYPVEVTAPQEQDPRYAYVLNSNFDQRFKTGWLSTIDLVALQNQLTHLSTADWSKVLDPDTGGLPLYVPSLGSKLSWSPTATNFLLTHRGIGTLTLVEVAAGGRVTCGDRHADRNRQTSDARILNANEADTHCDRAHLLKIAPKRFHPELSELDVNDPYAVRQFAVGDRTFAAVAYLNTPWLTLFSMDAWLAAEPQTKYFKAWKFDKQFMQAFALHVSQEQSPKADFLLAAGVDTATTDRHSGLFKALALSKLLDASDAEVINNEYVLADQLLISDIQELVFSPGGELVFALSKYVDAVLLFKSELLTLPQAASGTPPKFTLKLLDVLPIPGKLVGLKYIQRGPTEPDLVVVANFTEDTLLFFTVNKQSVSGVTETAAVLNLAYTLDLHTCPNQRGEKVQGTLAAKNPLTGQGPLGLQYITSATAAYLLVTNFYSHGLAVVDLQAQNALEFKCVVEVRNDRIPLSERLYFE